MVQTWASSDDAGLSGGVTHDQIRDEMRRHLEQMFDKEQSATKTVKNIGEDGRRKGLTSSYGSREALRFSSEERRRRTDFSPREAALCGHRLIREAAPLRTQALRASSEERRRHTDFSPREASYSARQECRFFSDRPARARSLTPDSGIRSAFAAGVASHSPRSNGLVDVEGHRGHGRSRAEAYRSRYSNNIFDTSLPGASSKEPPASSKPTHQPGAGKPADAQQSSGPLQSPSNGNSRTPAGTTSKAVKETHRFFPSSEEGSGRREVGVRTERPRTGDFRCSSGPEITLEGGTSRRSLLSSSRAAPVDAPGRQRTKTAEEGRSHENALLVADHAAGKTGKLSMGRASSRDSLPSYRGGRELGGIRPEHTAGQTGKLSMSRASSRDSLPSYRGGRELGGIRPSSRGYHTPCMPGCQDSLKARRCGTRGASIGKRDVQGRDLFEAGLRN